MALCAVPPSPWGGSEGAGALCSVLVKMMENPAKEGIEKLYPEHIWLREQPAPLEGCPST